MFFPLLNYENSKYLLFLLWSRINNDNLNEELIENLKIINLYYIINFAFIELNKKIDEKNFEQSKLLIKINKKIENLKFSISILKIIIK